MEPRQSFRQFPRHPSPAHTRVHRAGVLPLQVPHAVHHHGQEELVPHVTMSTESYLFLSFGFRPSYDSWSSSEFSTWSF